jgi:hypothetical protein
VSLSARHASNGDLGSGKRAGEEQRDVTRPNFQSADR